MAKCECIPKCPFFQNKMADMPEMSAMLKKRYCLGDKTKCARYAVRGALGAPAVPIDLFPNESARAAKLVAGDAR